MPKAIDAVGVAIIVAIRTFLSWLAELEMIGHWPWPKGASSVERFSSRSAWMWSEDE